MTDALMIPLISSAVLGLCFGPTRWLGIASTALLTLRHPWLVVFVAASPLLFFFKLRK